MAHKINIKGLLIAVSLLSVNTLFAQDKSKLSFSSSVQYGTQKNNITILLSSDFKGDYTMAGIKAATWKDITRKITLATGKESEESGSVNISKEMPDAGYVAIRYVGEPSAKPTQRSWSILDLKVSKGNSAILPVWKIVNDPQNKEGAGWNVGSNKISFRSNQSLIRSESWAITPIENK